MEDVRQRKYRFCFSYPPNYTPIAEPWQEKYTHDQGDPEYANAIREAVEEGRSAQLQDIAILTMPFGCRSTPKVGTWRA